MIANNRVDEGGAFVIIRRAPRHKAVDFEWQAQKYLEYAFALTLGFFMMLALLFPVFEREQYVPEVTPDMVFDATTVPITEQSGGGGQPTPPDKPAIPIEAEVETIAEDVTIEPTEYSLADLSTLPGPPGPPGSGRGTEPGSESGGVSVGPRLIKEVFPMVSQRVKGKGVRGEIEMREKIDEYGKVVDVEILKNTTNSAEIAQAAVEAAFRCAYIPAMSGKKPIMVWTIRKLRIDYSD